MREVIPFALTAIAVAMGFGSQAIGAPIGCTVGGGATGGESNYSLFSATNSVQHVNQTPLSGYQAGAYGGPTPSVSAEAWATTPSTFSGAYSSAYSGAEVVYQYRIMPADLALLGQPAPVRLGFYGEIHNNSGYDADCYAMVFSSAPPVANADGWKLATGGGGWRIEYGYSHYNGDMTFSGSPQFSVPYGSWVTVDIYAYTGVNVRYYGNVWSAQGHTFIDPTVSVDPAWALQHPGDRIEFTGPAPEPTTLSLLALGGLLIARRRRA